MRVALVLAVAVTALASIGSIEHGEGKAPVSMPDPVQTFNLWASFLESRSLDGAIALTFAPAVADPAGLRTRYDAAAARGAERGRYPVALGHEIDGAIAIVHFFDGWSASTGKPDIDPAFLVLDGRAWKLLPIFGKPTLPLAGLDEARNASLAKLLAGYQQTSHTLGEKYAPLAGPAPGSEPR